jgi:hypothetical protein
MSLKTTLIGFLCCIVLFYVAGYIKELTQTVGSVIRKEGVSPFLVSRITTSGQGSQPKPGNKGTFSSFLQNPTGHKVEGIGVDHAPGVDGLRNPKGQLSIRDNLVAVVWTQSGDEAAIEAGSLLRQVKPTRSCVKRACEKNSFKYLLEQQNLIYLGRRVFASSWTGK